MPRRRRLQGIPLNVGVIDIGTNSVHMLVVRIDAELKAHVIDKAKEMVRLGRGTFESRRLDEATQHRALAALSRFRRVADRRGVQRFLAVATSAVREAENGGAFLQEVYRTTGIHARVIPGGEEARLVWKANRDRLEDDTPTLLVDLGGGSVEIACGSARELLWCSSLPLGAQRLTPAGGTLDVAVIRERARAALRPHVRRAREDGVTRCLLTSGSATAMAKILRARGETGNGHAIPAKLVAALAEDLASMDAAKRAEVAGLENDRRDLIVGAMAFFDELVEGLGVDAVEVSDRAMREGLVQDFLDRHGEELQWELSEPNTRRRAVVRFGERFQYDARHAHHVAHLAGRIFDELCDLHDLGERERELLEYASLLHDVGYIVRAKGHHKHSEYLIINGLGGGFTESEIAAIAAVARYHRKAEPKPSHGNWAALDPDVRTLVERVGSILRIADGLDRSHARAVSDVRVVDDGRKVVIVADAVGPVELEFWAANRKSGWFRRVYGRDIEFRIMSGAKDESQEERQDERIE